MMLIVVVLLYLFNLSYAKTDYISMVNAMVSGFDNYKQYLFGNYNFNNKYSSNIDNIKITLNKSFKNSSGFYKIEGTFENSGPQMLTDINLIKYYKFKWLHNITKICYKQDMIYCEYK